MMKDAEEKTREIWKSIAKRINKLRRDKGITLEELSKKTGFAKSYLSQIENMKREPPISTLTKIAYVLNVDVMFLLTGEIPRENEEHLSIVKPAERRIVVRPNGSPEYTYESLTYKKVNRLMDAFLLTAGFEFPKEPLIHEGEELTFMLEGKQEFVYDGKSYIVEEGDCYLFDSSKPHYSKSIGDRPAKFLVVFTTKK
ncbi:MAG TPA: XRE family transcriptional regulator [Syntrophorhabdaceae bacterium]|nr:XRE family transcriptional regulator [Syntrophorhabdaceae bacterium]